MDLAIGALGSLLPKLGEVLKQELDFQKGVKKDLEYLEGELSNIHGALGKIAEAPRDEVSPEDKIWACNLRELSYDMEDVVDSFLLSVDGSEGDPNNPNTKTFKGLMEKMINLFKQAKERRQIATAIKDIKKQAEQVASCRERYMSRAPAARTQTTVDPFLVARFGQNNIIGINGARDEIIAKLREGDDVSKLQLKIVSIAGFGGLGKTTLARAVYESFENQFDYRAFVSVSRIFNAMQVFKDIFYQLDVKTYKELKIGGLSTESLVIDQLLRLLRTRRYFIVVDDIWHIEAWKTIRYALQDNLNGSIIITTTRNSIIAEKCCSRVGDINYSMKALTEDDAQKLFHERIFGINNKCPLQLENVSKDILKKCRGVPLAIITLASYLASGPNEHRKSNDKWFTLLKSIGHGLNNGDDNVKSMKKILALSYYDLPPPLKACLLSLSAFAEDCIIGKDRLIRRWIAEGFVVEETGTSQVETAECYFSDLINRSMVEPRNIHADGSAEACCVHDMMLDLIRDLSTEENFVTILDVMKAPNGKDVVMKENTHSKRKLRRLSVQRGMAHVTTTHLATRSLSQVRSITVFNPAISQILPLSEFEVLRVLDLEGCDLQESRRIDLRHVKDLPHLRYLGLRGTKVGSLPMEIGKLRFLQTLDVQGVNAKELPSSIVQLERLICLNLGPGMELPDGFSKMELLEQLTGLWVGFSSEDKAKELRYLTRLRELALKWKGGAEFLESLCRLQKLESLNILSCDGYIDMNELKPSPNLRRFRVCGYLQSFPKWINSSSVPVLSYIDLYLCEVRTEDIQSLGMLQTLRYVSLEVLRTNNKREGRHYIVENLVLTADAFPCARVCLFNKVVLVRPIIQKGAMQMVQRLRCGLQLCNIDSDIFDLSIPNLPSLEQLRIDIIETRESTSDECSRAIDMLKRVAEDHPRRPILRHAKFYYH